MQTSRSLTSPGGDQQQQPFPRHQPALGSVQPHMVELFDKQASRQPSKNPALGLHCFQMWPAWTSGTGTSPPNRPTSCAESDQRRMAASMWRMNGLWRRTAGVLVLCALLLS
ncbi:hypothetical protein INR49_000057, partial [Caranx melampygus]